MPDSTQLSGPRFGGLELGAGVAGDLEAVLPRMAERTVAAIIAEVPAYTDPFQGRMGQNIENAVQASLRAFLGLATHRVDESELSAVLDAAYELGRGEARAGRSIDALLAAFRVGAREAWRELSAAAVASGLPAQTVALFAEMVFAYIDELSASSVSGHADEQATAGRVRQRYLDLLIRKLLAGEPIDVLSAAADRAVWAVPSTLTAVLLAPSQMRGLTTVLTSESLQATDDLPGLDAEEGWAVVLVADVDGPRRPALLRALAGRRAVVGPSRPWHLVKVSYRRAVRARRLSGADAVLDTDEHLVEVVLDADREAVTDLRARVLAPLDAVRDSTADRLVETLRSWLLHQGQRDAVAADLHVHPQTVRYRMGQIRELYGESLNDPRTILELTVALGAENGAHE
ncbi:MAG: PucR family transcriptional regulator [Mycobacterium sp.]